MLEFGAKTGKKFIKNSQKNAKFDEENNQEIEKTQKFNYSIANFFWRFLTKKLRLENGAMLKTAPCMHERTE